MFIVLYNIFVCIGNVLILEIVGKLSDILNVVGVKDFLGNFINIFGYIFEIEKKDFSVLLGND